MLTTRRGTVLYTLCLAMAGCQNGQNPGQMTLDQIKQYAASFMAMVEAAAQVYLASPNAKDSALVQEVLTQLTTLEQALQNAQAQTDVRSIVLQVISFAQQIEPLVAVFLGPNATFYALGLAVLQAFVSAVPAPQNAPTPAQMDGAVRRLRVERPVHQRNSR